MIALRGGSQEKIKNFAFVAAYVGTIARRSANLADYALREAIIALVFRKGKWQRFEYFFKKVLQTGNISRESDGNRLQDTMFECGQWDECGQFAQILLGPAFALRAMGLIG